MSFLPISLGVRRKPDTGEAAFRSRSRLKEQMEKTLWRDDFTCRCCGFQSKKYQRVISVDPDANSKDQFITVCSFCELCFSVDLAGLTGSGVLIWLPEISQSNLHHIMRAIYVVRGTDHPLADSATRAYDALIARRTEAKKRLGSDDPLLLATVLQESLTDKEYAARTAKLEGIRLMPLERWLTRGPRGDVNHFPQVVKYWRSSEGPFGKLPPETWASMFDSVLNQISKPH